MAEEEKCFDDYLMRRAFSIAGFHFADYRRQPGWPGACRFFWRARFELPA